MAIKVLVFSLVAKESFLKCYVNVHVEIVLHAFEYIVWLLLESNNDVALEHVWYLLSLTLEDYLLPVCHSLRDVYLESFWLHLDFAPLASGTVFLIGAPFTFAFIARLLHLHLHKAHVLDNFDLSRALALWTGLGFAALSTRTFAFGAVDVPLHCEFLANAIVQFVKGHLKADFALWPLHPIVASALVSLDLVLALLIINLFLNFVSENLMSSVDLCELLSRILIAYYFDTEQIDKSQ